MVVGEKYPNEPPQITFLNKINMSGVNQTTGAVDPNSFALLKNWNRKYTLMDLLKSIRKDMESLSKTQPEEGSRFYK